MHTRELATKEASQEELDDNNTVFYQSTQLYMAAQTKILIGKYKPYALVNISNNNMDDEYNLISSSDAFDTDNCANHHICSDFSLFIKSAYHELDQLRVQRILGGVIAKVIGKIEFIIINNGDNKHEIILDNII